MAARQAPLSSAIAWSWLRFTSVQSVVLSNHLILGCPLLLLPSVFPSIRVFSNELAKSLLMSLLNIINELIINIYWKVSFPAQSCPRRIKILPFQLGRICLGKIASPTQECETFLPERLMPQALCPNNHQVAALHQPQHRRVRV